MKVIKINAEERKIEEIELVVWEDAPSLISPECKDICLHHSFSIEAALYVDPDAAENLFLYENRGGFTIKGYEIPIIGNGIVFQNDSRDGITIKKIKSLVKWIPRKRCLEWASIINPSETEDSFFN